MCRKATRSRKMTTIARACVFVTVCAAFVKASTSSMVDIEPKRETAVRLDENLRIMCRISDPIRVCRVKFAGMPNSLILFKGDPPVDGVEYYGDGLPSGQCGVQINRVKEIHNGNFMCFLTNYSREVEANLNIIVARPPEEPNLYMSPGANNKYVYQKGDHVAISCSVTAGRPAPNISLFLDDELLTNDWNTIYNTVNVYNKSLSMQNISRTLEWTDNGRTLRCMVNHIALEYPKERTMQLEVQYPPQPHPSFERFGYVIGRQGVVNVTIYANPAPRFTWRVNNEKIDAGRPDESNRIQTSSPVDLGKGAWSLIFTIDSVQKSDTEKEYVLEASNHLGTYDYRIVLSTSAEPAGVDLDAGSIIGIVVGVLVLVLIIFLVIFARATGRWCFAGRSSTRNLAESDFADPATSISLLRHKKSKTVSDVVRKRSDTESAGRYSRSETDGASSQGQRKPRINLSRLFGRNKDKVSGADTDTLKTVVTINDEKLQTAEPATQEGTTNPPTGEGGIVYAELDLTQQQQSVAPRRLNEDKTEYAEILYTNTEPEEEKAEK